MMVPELQDDQSQEAGREEHFQEEEEHVQRP